VELSTQSQAAQEKKFESFKDFNDEKQFDNYQDTLLNDSDSDGDETHPDSPTNPAPEKDEKVSVSPTKLVTMMSKKEKLVAAKAKILTNIDASKKALTNHQSHVKELKLILKSQPSGAAKQELTKVLENAKGHVSDLESHIKQGEALLEAKENSIEEIEKNLKKTSDADVG